MRHCARSHSAYRYGFASLIGIYAILWTGGTVWHSLTCGHHHHAHFHGCEFVEHDTNAGGHCDHDHHAGSQSPETPAKPAHDEESCPICQWFNQAQSTPVVLQSDFCEQLIGLADLSSAESPSTIVEGLYQPRAPPA